MQIFQLALLAASVSAVGLKATTHECEDDDNFRLYECNDADGETRALANAFYNPVGELEIHLFDKKDDQPWSFGFFWMFVGKSDWTAVTTV